MRNTHESLDRIKGKVSKGPQRQACSARCCASPKQLRPVWSQRGQEGWACKGLFSILGSSTYCPKSSWMPCHLEILNYYPWYPWRIWTLIDFSWETLQRVLAASLLSLFWTCTCLVSTRSPTLLVGSSWDMNVNKPCVIYCVRVMSRSF